MKKNHKISAFVFENYKMSEYLHNFMNKMKFFIRHLINVCKIRSTAVTDIFQWYRSQNISFKSVWRSVQGESIRFANSSASGTFLSENKIRSVLESIMATCGSVITIIAVHNNLFKNVFIVYKLCMLAED